MIPCLPAVLSPFVDRFLLYPGIATKLLSMFNCVEAGDGSEYMRVDLSLRCSSPDGPDRLYVFYTAFAIIMIILHVIGYPAVYAYLFFRRHRTELVLLRQQEILDAHLEKVPSARDPRVPTPSPSPLCHARSQSSYPTPPSSPP